MAKKIKGKVLFIFAFVLCSGLSNCRYESEGISTKRNNRYQAYINQVELKLKTLSKEQVNKRHEILKTIESSLIYSQLKDSLISEEYLKVLELIGNGIRESYIDEKGIEMFALDDLEVAEIEKSRNGKAKMEFVINCIILTLTDKGGFSKQIVDIFDRYLRVFKYYGNPSRFYDSNSKRYLQVETVYNISPIFGILDPKNKKVLEAIYEANEQFGHWQKNKADRIYVNSFIATKKGYIDFVRNNFTYNKYIPKLDNSSFWNEYDTIVRSRIDFMIIDKDCDGLQKEFNIASDNDYAQRHRTGSGNIDLMDFINRKLEEIDCY